MAYMRGRKIDNGRDKIKCSNTLSRSGSKSFTLPTKQNALSEKVA